MRNRSIPSNSLLNFLQKVFLGEKLDNWIGFVIAIAIACSFGYFLSNDILLGIEIFAGIVGISILMLCFLSPESGLYIMTFYGFTASAIGRFLFNDQLPVGVITDILCVTIFLGLFFSNNNLKQNTRQFFRLSPIIWYTVIFAYLTLQLFNPFGHSFMGWFQVMRKVSESFLILFMAYNILDNRIKIFRFIKVLFFLALVVGSYACFQQWHGLLQSEIDWVAADPIRFGLICLWGEYRKFSLFGGPTEFGIVMASCSLLFMLLGLNQKKVLNKILYITGSVFMLLGMSYSGTRTANAMFAGGIGFFILLTITKKSSQIFAGLAIMTFLFILYVPIYTSASLNRFRSTFSATSDPSYGVRETNRQTVQPFIWSHPFGTGLSTTGSMGEKYNPGNPNAGFPADSSYLNKALEGGWIGMSLTCFLYFFTLRYVIRGYFVAKSKEWKTVFAACAAFFFSYYLGEIAQEAVGIFSNIMVYFPVFGLVLRLRQFSEENNEQLSNV